MHSARSLLRISVLDSHTAGEPTRLVMDGTPDLGGGPVAHQLSVLRDQHDVFRRRVLLEPRGSDILVGALLCPPQAPGCTAGVIFFNNAGYLGMCGHGMIGVAATLSYLDRIRAGRHKVETPVGDVAIHLAENGEVTVANVDAYRYRARVLVQVEGYGTVHGDVAWGGNWFFLVEEHPFALTLAHEEQLMDFTWKLRQALISSGVTGADGAEIDHIELFTAPHHAGNHSRNFVLCPGKEYDRSPCGTGTSAKMACLLADGKLAPGQLWRQEGILDTVFTGHVELSGSRIQPYITGSAYVTAESSLIFQPNDPFRNGVPEPGSIAK